jgi:hypothetical protein
MQKKAIEMHSSLKRIGRFLRQEFTAVSKETFLERVNQAVEREREELGLLPLDLDTTKVDWQRLMLDACYRRAPFQEGEKKEKGFRDALIGESFLQLVADSPKAADVCRVVLVTCDKLLTSAVNSRLSAVPNAAVLLSIQELKGLINTLSSDVDEAFIARLRSKAEKLFFVSGESRDTLYYTHNIRQRLMETFEATLARTPDELTDTTYRRNGQWWINAPTFVRKEVSRVFWSSRLDIETEAIRVSAVSPTASYTQYNALAMRSLSDMMMKATTPSVPSLIHTATHRGMDAYEVIWSTEVTMSETLEQVLMEDMKHIGVTWDLLES